ncbi:MAG: efflux RND transporter periplasmic adaptor subunit [Phycisphaeraceae bacterium]
MTADADRNKTHRTARPGGARRWASGVVGLVLFAAIAGVLVLAFMPEQEAEAPADARGERTLPVRVAEVRGVTLQETVLGVGTLRATAVVEVRPEVAGRVRSITFEEGSFVEEGQLLVEIDDDKLRRQLASREAALRAAQVAVDNAQRTFARQQQLRDRGVVSADDFDQAQAALNSAEAEVDRLEAELALVEQQVEDTQIRAPFGGMISQRMVDRGAYVNAGDDLARLYQTDPLEIAFSVPERYMGQVQSGQPVAVTVTAYPDRTFDGVVDFVSPAIDEATRSFLVKARIDNPDAALMPGGFATAVVVIGERTDRPVVPAESLVATRRGFSVFTVGEDERATMQDVSTGLRRQGMVEVTEGVSVGDRVVRTGHLRLSGGERVRVVEEADVDDQSQSAAVAAPLAKQDE